MKKYLFFSIIAILIIISIVRINIINTEILSPVGNFQDNFDKINKEFGEDFSEFIMDKSPIKIYLGEEGDNSATVKLNKKEINLTKNNPFLKVFNPVIDYFNNSYKKIEEKINRKKENKKEVNEIKNKSELENVVDDFINSLEDE
jgi:peptidoglycan hydrolase CwlO-like protein